MEKKTYLFAHKDVRLKVTIPVENEAAITNEYCPQELVTGGLSFITAVNGESVNEFIADCQKQVIAMGETSNTLSKLDRHIGGLMAVVMEHLTRCGRLIFGDLLIYVDCFAHLLIADGVSIREVKTVYPRITKTIVDFYPDYVKATADLSRFDQTPIYVILCDLARR